MRIVLAPDSFKGSATALEVCLAMEEGVQRVCSDAEIILAPVTDGGEGLVENLTAACGGERIRLSVTGPAGRPAAAAYAILSDGVCVIEMAQAAGLTLLSEEERDPLVTTTRGVGEMILDALDRGCRRFIIGLGGSATNDGGCGMAAALGYGFRDEDGQEIGPGGGSLGRLAEIRTDHVDERIADADFVIACDVKNPLCGANGASHVFGPQKGATAAAVRILDQNLGHLADIIKRDLSQDIRDIPGAGAAGGMGAGCVAFLGGRLEAGIRIVTERMRLEDSIRGADLVFTGEGKWDRQTLSGKAPYGIVSLAKKHGVPSVVIAGDADPETRAAGMEGVRGIIGIRKEGMTLEYAMQHVRQLVADAAEEAMTAFTGGSKAADS